MALSRLVEVVRPNGGVVLDVATGAGHTAFAFSPFVDRVIASDITSDMLRVTRNEAKRRSLANLNLAFVLAEALPFCDAALQGITCRMGAHHFQNVKKFLSECARALSAGGWLLIVDTIGSEDPDTDEQIDAYERLRDPSHVRNLKRSVWLEMIEAAGLKVNREESRPKEVDFEEWIERMNVPGEHRETLRRMALDSTGGFRSYLNPCERDGRMHFHLAELMIHASKA